MSEKIDQQLQLEEEAVSMGQQRYDRRLEDYKHYETEDQTGPAMAMMRRVVGPVAEAIEADRNTTRRGRARIGVSLLEGVESEVLAWHGLRSIISSISSRVSHTKAVLRCGTAIRDEINFRRFKDDDKRSYRITQEHLKQAPTGGHKQGIMRRMFKLSDIEPVEWSTEQLVHVGTYVLDITLRVSGWAKAVVTTESRNRSRRILDPSPSLMAWLEDAHEQLALLSPVRMPMVVPPKDWVSPTEGGYLTDCGGQLTLVKTINQGYLDALEQVEMPEVYDAINTIQQVPWRVNRRLMEVARKLWAEGAVVGSPGSESLPSRDPLPIPPIPAEWEGRVKEWKAADFTGFKLWAQRAAVVHDENRRMVSKRVAAANKLTMAERFVDEDAIYFPHQLDFRGRIYPACSYLNPQGDDLSKALLEFSEGKRLGADGVFWLKVHTANCFGVDKVSFEERAAWVDRMLEPLLDSGLQPLGGDEYWREADDPFMALAACMELVGWSIEGEDYVSHLPVSMDGSCNGLQNFSALLRDAVGGRATNLVPQDAPADIYQQVADIVSERVQRDAESGNEWAIRFDGFVDRKLVKQPVMTLPYGATRNGMLRQIEAAVKKAGNPMALSTKETWPACGYIADVTYEAIGQVVIAARSAMDWLQDVARLAASEDYPVSWTTPVGLPVLQDYRTPQAHPMYVHVDGQQVKLKINHVGTKRDKRRQAAGISPNLIHSFDAAHMMKTALLGAANGISAFAMVHDSYGCHAADVAVLHASIREAFIEMYRDDLLDRFAEEVSAQLPDTVELPPVPPSGSLDLDAVRDSWYFFA